MEDGNAVVAANGTEEWHKVAESWVPLPNPERGTHEVRIALCPRLVKKIIGGKIRIDGQLVLWPPLTSKDHPYTIDIWNNRYRRCCTCDKWFVHNPRWCGGCKRVVYCSTACQTRDWNDHKYICAHYIGARVNIVTCARAAMRSIHMTQMEREHEAALAKCIAIKTKQEANCICPGCRRKCGDPCKHLYSTQQIEEEVLCWDCMSELANWYVLAPTPSSSSGAASSSS